MSSALNDNGRLRLSTQDRPPARIGSRYRIAAIVPCRDEAATVARVVGDLRRHVPGISVYVYDNLSSDDTASVASAAGATVRYEDIAGKGNVIRRAFADIDADIYLMIDGDDTYDAAVAPEMIRTLVEGHYDQVLGVRQKNDDGAYRSHHEWGNKMLNAVVASVFGTNVGDMLSGYRVFSRRFVKSFPAVSHQFEIETELTVHSLVLRTPLAPVPVGYRQRAVGTESKLHTYRDGVMILRLILSLMRHERPIAFYGLFAAFFALVGLGLGLPVMTEFLATGLVPQIPTVVAVTALWLAACLAVLTGLILDGVRQARDDLVRLAYLAQRDTGT